MRLPVVPMLLALVSLPLAAAPTPLDVYTATASGSLTIGANGNVLDVDLASAGDLGTGVLEGFEQRIRAWRFEPITEDGKPVNAVGRMHLVLVAAKRPGESTATFGINRVSFIDPPGAEPDPALAERATLPLPVYPRQALMAGMGARLELLLRLGPDGRPTDVATERLLLLGSQGKNNTRVAAQFQRSAESVMRTWRFPGFPDGAVVMVPLSYTTQAEGWVRTRAAPVELPAWAIAGRQGGDAIALADGGGATVRSIRLLTPLDPMVAGGDG